MYFSLFAFACYRRVKPCNQFMRLFGSLSVVSTFIFVTSKSAKNRRLLLIWLYVRIIRRLLPIVTMWKYMRLLPEDFCGSLIFSFLSLKDFACLNSAFGNLSTDHQSLARMMSFSGPVDVWEPLSHSVQALNWLWQRNMKPSDVFLNIHGERTWWSEMLRAVQSNLHRIGQLHVDVSYSTLGPEEISPFQRDEALAAKVTALYSYTTKNESALFNLCHLLKNLQTFVFWADGGFSLETATVLQSCVSLSDVSLVGKGDISEQCFLALAERSNTLTATYLSVNHFTNEGLSILAQCTKLKYIGLHCDKKHIRVSLLPGLLAIVRSCQQLQRISLDVPQFDNAIDILSHYCPKMSKVQLDCQTLLTGDMLRALRVNCPHLVELTGPYMIREPQIHLCAAAAEIEANAEVFRHLHELSLNSPPTGDWETPALLAVAHNLIYVRTLTLDGDSIDHTVVRALADTCTLLNTLTMRCQPQPELQEAMVALVRNNRLLQNLTVHNTAAVLSDALLIALGETCPRLQFVSARCVSEGLHDHAVVVLARGCRKLDWVEEMIGSEITDVAARALADHCPELKGMDLAHSPLVSNAALVNLMQRCKGMRHLYASPGRDVDQLMQAFSAAGLLVDIWDIAQKENVSICRRDPEDAMMGMASTSEPTAGPVEGDEQEANTDAAGGAIDPASQDEDDQDEDTDGSEEIGGEQQDIGESLEDGSEHSDVSVGREERRVDEVTA